MKSTIKGLKININVSVKADEIATINHRHDDGRDRRNEEAYKGLNINAGVGIEIDESNGDVDLREISDLLHNSLTESVREQVKECLNEAQKPESDFEKEVRRNTSE